MQELQPQLSELLRTCVHPPSLLLKVAYVDYIELKNDLHEDTSLDSRSDATILQNDDYHATKFLLTDGHLMVQALLHRKLSTLRDATQIQVDDLLDIRRFAVKKSPRSNGRGRIVYLAIEDCTFLLKPRSQTQSQVVEETSQSTRKRKRSPQEDSKEKREDTDLGDEGQFMNSQQEPPPAKRAHLDSRVQEHMYQQHLPGIEQQPTKTLESVNDNSLNNQQKQQTTIELAHKDEEADLDTPKVSNTRLHGRKRSERENLGRASGARNILLDDEDEPDDFFEAVKVDRAIIDHRRQAISKLKNKKRIGMKELHESIQTYPNVAIEEPKRTAISHDGIPSIKPIDAKNEEPQLPQLPTSKRDGTFALSQMPTSVQSHQQSKIPAINVLPPTVNPQQPTQPALLPPPPFHTLRSLRNPPRTQPLPKSYTITTLAIITWTGTSLIHRPGSPFPPKRHVKIIDPSLSSSRPPSREDEAQPGSSAFRPQTAFQDSVTVAVYLDAATFKPAPGTIALFQGLVMQRLPNRDIILNVYARLKDQRFEQTTGKTSDDSAKLPSDGREMNVEETRTDVSSRRHTEPIASNLAASDSDTPNSDSHWFITSHEKIRALGYGSKLDYYTEWWKDKQQGSTSRGS